MKTQTPFISLSQKGSFVEPKNRFKGLCGQNFELSGSHHSRITKMLLWNLVLDVSSFLVSSGLKEYKVCYFWQWHGTFEPAPACVLSGSLPEISYFNPYSREICSGGLAPRSF